MAGLYNIVQVRLSQWRRRPVPMFFFCHDPSFPLHLEPNYLWHHQHHHHSHRQMLHHDDCFIMGCLLSGPMLGKNRCNMVLISSYWFILAIWWLLLLLLHMQKMFQGHVVRFPIYTSYSASILSSLFNISENHEFRQLLHVGGNISILINFMRPSFNVSVVLVNFESFQKKLFFHLGCLNLCSGIE